MAIFDTSDPLVDMEQGKVLKQVDLTLKATGAVKPVAGHVSGFRRSIALNSQGARLFIASVYVEGSYKTDRPLGLSVIDTSTFSEIQSIELPISEVRISPDGQRIVGAGLWGALQGDGLYILDATTGHQLAQMEPGSGLLIRGFSPDSRYVYLSLWSDSLNRESELQLVDLRTYHVAQRRRLEGFLVGLSGAIVQ